MVCSASLFASVRAAFKIVEADLQRAAGHLRPPVLGVRSYDSGGFRVLQVQVGNVHDPIFDPDFSALFHGSPFQEFPYLTGLASTPSTTGSGSRSIFL